MFLLFTLRTLISDEFVVMPQELNHDLGWNYGICSIGPTKRYRVRTIVLKGGIAVFRSTLLLIIQRLGTLSIETRRGHYTDEG